MFYGGGILDKRPYNFFEINDVQAFLDRMTEYIIVVALIAVAAIGVYTLFGQTIRNQTAGLALEVSGQTASTAISAAQANADTASTNADVRKGLDNYDADNH